MFAHELQDAKSHLSQSTAQRVPPRVEAIQGHHVKVKNATNDSQVAVEVTDRSPG